MKKLIHHYAGRRSLACIKWRTKDPRPIGFKFFRAKTYLNARTYGTPPLDPDDDVAKPGAGPATPPGVDSVENNKLKYIVWIVLIIILLLMIRSLFLKNIDQTMPIRFMQGNT